jgi:hypothetical protein
MKREKETETVPFSPFFTTGGAVRLVNLILFGFRCHSLIDFVAGRQAGSQSSMLALTIRNIALCIHHRPRTVSQFHDTSSTRFVQRGGKLTMSKNHMASILEIRYEQFDVSVVQFSFKSNKRRIFDSRDRQEVKMMDFALGQYFPNILA